ncbi:MAG: hypothetical protein ACI8TP_003604 [Acidimicrobiales bacterium]|jgi:hypothetical protein
MRRRLVNRSNTSLSGIRRLIVMVVAATLLLSACGKAAEMVTEEAIERQSGGDVNVSDDGESISFESEDGSGSISIESDDDGETGTISGTDTEGNEFSTSVGGSEIPDDFPMPVFEPSTVVAVITSETSAGSAFIVKLEIARGDADAALAFYEDWFSAEGMEIMALLEIGLGGILAGTDTAAAQVSIIDGPPVEVLLNWSPIG